MQTQCRRSQGASIVPVFAANKAGGWAVTEFDWEL